MLDTGYRLQVTGYRLQVTGYRLQVTGYRLQVTGCRFQISGCMTRKDLKIGTIRNPELETRNLKFEN